MKEYNDYVQTTKRWLKNYNKFRITIENLQDDIASLRKQNETDANAPIAKYGDSLGGGTPELNTVETLAYRHSVREAEIAEKEQSIEAIERTMRKIDRAFDGLDGTDYALVHGYYIENKPWELVGSENFFSEKWAQERGSRAVRKMAEMIFGVKTDQQLRFVFAE